MVYRVFAAAATVCVAYLSAAAGAQPLPSDPALVKGELDNGLRYIIRQHAVPPGRATVWVHIHSGSLNETEAQRGLAHYLEHMAFNGSEHFKPGSLVPFFQSLGMTFGRDQNAFTNFEQTTYQLSMPDAKPQTLTQGMTFFADVVGRLSLLPSEIENERQIIQEERRRGLSGRQRTGYYVLERMAPGSLFGQRNTIGTEETINGVKEQDFRDYYNSWYMASNATLIVLADADPAIVTKAIGDAFSSLPKKPRPTSQDIGVKAYDKSFAIVTSDPEVRSAEVRILRIEPGRAPVTTVPQMRAELVERIASSAFNRRMGDLVAAGSTKFQNCNVSMGTDSGVLYSVEFSARSQGDSWKESLNEMATEVRRAQDFGFTDHEVEAVRKELISGAERAVETESTIPAAQLIARINNDVAAGEPTMNASQRLTLLKELLPSISSQEVSQFFLSSTPMRNVAFVAVLPSTAQIPTEDELVKLGTDALKVKPEKRAEAAQATKLLDKAPTAGTVTQGEVHAATDVWTGWLSNNVRVTHKFMDERKNEISVHVNLLGGELLETGANRGITRAAELAWSRSSTKKLSSTQVRELMTGKKIDVRGGGGFGGGRGGGGRGPRGGGGGGGGGDGISLNISGSPAELETGLELAYLLLTEPKIEQSAFDQFKTNTKERLAESLTNPMSYGMRLAGEAPYPESEPRTHATTAVQIDALTLPAAQAWLEKLIAESPIEVTIVGDMKREDAMALVAKYIGAVPMRDRPSAEKFAALRKIERPKGPRVFEKTVDSPTPQAFVLSGFYGCDETNLDDTRAMNLAARILSTRMVKEVREEAQLVYSIGASSRAASTYPGFGVFSAGAPTEPAKAAALTAKLSEMYAKFRESGPTDEEVDVARKQTAKNFEDQMKEPSFWFGRLQGLTLKGMSLDEIAEAPEAYQKVSAKQIKETFAKYYTPDNVIQVVVRPGANAGGEGK
jgi:zinc protease